MPNMVEVINPRRATGYSSQLECVCVCVFFSPGCDSAVFVLRITSRQQGSSFKFGRF